MLKEPVALHVKTAVKIAIVTGRSDPSSCSLSLEQLDVLKSLDAPDEFKVYCNFPFVRAHRVERVPNIVRASISNGAQFLESHTATYARRAKPHWQSLLDSCDHLFLVTGSCGIQLVEAGIAGAEPKCNVEVLAIGPVGWQRSQLRVTTVQGDKDFISRRFYKKVDRVVPGVSHLDYWYNPIVKELIHQWLSIKISRLLEQEDTCRSSA